MLFPVTVTPYILSLGTLMVVSLLLAVKIKRLELLILVLAVFYRYGYMYYLLVDGCSRYLVGVMCTYTVYIYRLYIYIIQEGTGHSGLKSCKVVFINNHRLFTTGFSKSGDREIALWNAVS